MKRSLAVLLVAVLLLGFVGAAFARADDERAELDKVKKYLVVLDQKIKQARAQRHINKLAQLKHLKRQELARAKKLVADISALESGSKKAAGPKPVPAGLAAWRRLQANAGFGGGGLLLGIGYVMPVARVELLPNAGIGIGNGYTILSAGLAAVIPLGDACFGVEGGLVDYSARVGNIPGVSGNLEKGMSAGFGVFAGRKIGPVRARVGYNSALGLTLGAAHRF